MNGESKSESEQVSSSSSTPKPNSKLKDAFFRYLFNCEIRALELYLALHKELRSKLRPEDIEIIKLPEVFGNMFRNDLAFLVKGEQLIIMCEHQSTVNLNMPLRFLIYYVLYLLSIVESKGLYALTRIMLLRPEFHVFYNGTRWQPKERTMHLADSFLDGDGSWINLRVECHNINLGENSELLEQCESLRYYSLFIDMVRQQQPSTKEELNKVIRRTVEYFIEHDMLRDFMLEHKGEVVDMCTEEWSEDKALDIRYEDGVKYGEEKGLKKGIKEGKKEGVFEAQLNTICKLKDSFQWTGEQAMDFLAIPVNERDAYHAVLARM